MDNEWLVGGAYLFGGVGKHGTIGLGRKKKGGVGREMQGAGWIPVTITTTDPTARILKDSERPVRTVLENKKQSKREAKEEEPEERKEEEGSQSPFQLPPPLSPLSSPLRSSTSLST